MFVRNLLLIGLSWLLGRGADSLIPYTSQLTYETPGDYLTLVIMKPLNVMGFIILNMAGLLLLRRIILANIGSGASKGLQMNNPLVNGILLLLSMFILTTYAFRNPLTAGVMIAAILLADIRRWLVHRRNRVKMRQLFREYQ